MKKWIGFEELTDKMINPKNPNIRPHCSQILSECAWSLSHIEILKLQVETDINDYPDHLFKTYTALQ